MNELHISQNNLSATITKLDYEIPQKEEVKHKYQLLNWYKYDISDLQREIIDNESKDININIPYNCLISKKQTGVGKTSLAIQKLKEYTNEFIDKNKDKLETNPNLLFWYSADFITFNQILDLINKAKFGAGVDKSNAYDKLNELKQAKMIVIDEFKANKSGAKSDYYDVECDNYFCELFESLYGSNAKVIITTNNTLDEFKNNSWITQRTFSRLVASIKGNFITLDSEIDRRINS